MSPLSGKDTVKSAASLCNVVCTLSIPTKDETSTIGSVGQAIDTVLPELDRLKYKASDAAISSMPGFLPTAMEILSFLSNSVLILSTFRLSIFTSHQLSNRYNLNLNPTPQLVRGLSMTY